jgi:hypothetical protein
MEDRVRGRDITAQVVENMRSQGEELRYSTIVPAVYDVYLHAADYQRLESLAGLISEQTRRALDEELERLNRAGGIESRVRDALGRQRTPYERAGTTWEIRLIPDPNDELAPGDIVVDSTLVLAGNESLSGSRTRRMVTTRNGERMESREAPAIERPSAAAPSVPPAAALASRPAGESVAAAAASAARPETASPPTNGGAPTARTRGLLATLTWRDENGEQEFRMEKPQLVVGRGGPGYWVDLKLRTVPDVSRDHLRLRYDESERRFYIKDLSTLGTTVNGTPIPSSVVVRDGEKVDQNVEVPLPAEAEIGLAGAVVLRFRAEVAP